jgi:hypothetical protein
MMVETEVSPSGVYARRLEKNVLRLQFKVPHPQNVTLRLACFDGAWIWEEDLGLVVPGEEAVEMELKDWPQDISYLLARFFEGDGSVVAAAAQWLPAPTLVAFQSAQNNL